MSDKEKIKTLLRELEKSKYTNSTLHNRIKNLKKRNKELMENLESALNAIEFYKKKDNQCMK